MTNREALAAKINIKLATEKLDVALLDHNLSPESQYVGTSKEFDLALADIYVLLVTTPMVQEGGYQLDMKEKAQLTKLADGIFSKYGLSSPLSKTITIKRVL
jgi:hypothetical protein